MFPPRCIHPPWRNIEVNRVVQNGAPITGARSRAAAYSRGTTPQDWMNDCRAASGRLISRRKARMFRAMNAQVTTGVDPVVFSSPIGNIGAVYLTPLPTLNRDLPS